MTMVNVAESALLRASECGGAYGCSDTSGSDTTPIKNDVVERRRRGPLHWIAVLRRVAVGNRVALGVLVLVGVACLLSRGGRAGGDEGDAASPSSREDLLALSAGARRAPAAPLLRQPLEVASAHGHLDVRLTVEAADLSFANGASFRARTYNGTFPGPTLVVRPGDTLTITLVNRLGAEAAGGTPLPPGTLRLPNTTALHAHGFHVSPAGSADNVFRAVGPGEEATFVYDLPATHPAGLFYYHPHFHGSSAYQASTSSTMNLVRRGRGLGRDLVRRRRSLGHDLVHRRRGLGQNLVHHGHGLRRGLGRRPPWTWPWPRSRPP